MKYSSYIDNITAMEWGMDIKLAYLFDWVYTLPSWASAITTEEGTFYFASKTKAIEELPLLTDKTDTMYRYYKGLSEMGLIKLLKVGNKDFIQLTDKAKEWGKSSDRSEKNPSFIGKKSEIRSEKNPTDKITIYDKNTSIIEDKKRIFKESIEPFVPKYGSEMCNAFYQYWAEATKDGKKLRWERESTWEVNLRLARWKANNDGKVNNSFSVNKNQQVLTSVPKPENLRN